MKALLVAIACCCLFMACRKNRSSNELVGEWKLVGTSRGGQSWQTVSFAETQTLIFSSNGTFQQKPSMLSSYSGCIGTYEIKDGNTVMMKFSCPGLQEYDDMVVYTRAGNTLILDHVLTGSALKTKYIKN